MGNLKDSKDASASQPTADALSDKDILEAVSKLNGNMPDSFMLPDWLWQHLGATIEVIKTMGGEIQIIFGDTEYTLTLTQQPISDRKPRKARKNA